jgi:hypothetical protein
MTERVIIMMPLLDEGVEVWRPVEAEPLDNDRYRIVGPIPDDEEWAFAPGSIVIGSLSTFYGGVRKLTAKQAD